MPPGKVAARFHNTLAQATANACVLVAPVGATVVLSGGVFQNLRLLEGTAARLADAGFRVLTPERLPPNGNSPMRESVPLDASPPGPAAAAPGPMAPRAIRFRGTGFAPAPRGLTELI